MGHDRCGKRERQPPSRSYAGQDPSSDWARDWNSRGNAEIHHFPGSPDRVASHSGRGWTKRICGTRDRKSTRLNSSHGYISYAVFCLKKKKTEHTAAVLTKFVDCDISVVEALRALALVSFSELNGVYAGMMRIFMSDTMAMCACVLAT